MSNIFVGFDGFTDHISQAVDQRESATLYTPIPTLRAFGERIAEASGKSGNIELVLKNTQIGGNAPLLAQGLFPFHRVSFAGLIGYPQAIEPLFAFFAEQCDSCYPLGPSGETDAIEFEDGKLFLGKQRPLLELHLDQIVSNIDFVDALNRCDLFASVNWTMLPIMNSLWRYIAHTIVAQLTTKKRWMFVDLADPAKRTDHDILEALNILKTLQTGFHVVLGLNHAEALRVGQLLGTDANPSEIRRRANLSQVVIHSPTEARAANREEECVVKVDFCKKPVIQTGAGDTFNAGYCHGLVSGWNLAQTLQNGVLLASRYVHTGLIISQSGGKYLQPMLRLRE